MSNTNISTDSLAGCRLSCSRRAVKMVGSEPLGAMGPRASRGAGHKAASLRAKRDPLIDQILNQLKHAEMKQRC